METYKIVFSSASVINEIPNSQTIFGAICNILLQTQGKEAFHSYIDSFNQEAELVHSSMFLNHTLPMVKKNVFSLDLVNQMITSVKPEKKLEVLESPKKYKKLSYMSEEIYKAYIKTNKVEQLTKDLQMKKDKFEIIGNTLVLKKEEIDVTRENVLLTRNGFPEKEMDKTLFYTNAQYYPKYTEFCIYVKTKKSEKELEKLFQYFEYFGIGSRKSIGSNVFKLKRIEKIKEQTPEEYQLILSRYIPKEGEVDIKNSFYQLSSNIYRASKEYAGGYVDGKFIHIMEGSFMKTIEEKPYYGKVIKTKVNDKPIYHYAIGFVL